MECSLIRLNIIKKKRILIFFLYFLFSLNSLFAFEKNYGKLTEISLKEGLNDYQKEAANLSGLTESLKANTDKSHTPFNFKFRSASVDLNNDGFDEVFVSVQNSGWCGSGGCSIDILINDLEWIEAGTFRPEYFYVSDQTKYGLRIIYYETNCRSDIDETICDFYKIEPSSSRSYAGGSTFLVEKDKKGIFGYGNLTEITLEKGLNEKQAREVVTGLEKELMDLFNYWLTESHFIYGAEPHLNFNIDFSAASVELDNDNLKDLLVKVEHSINCGVGACSKVDILLSGDITAVNSGFFHAKSRIYVSDRTKHGLRYLFYEGNCRTNIDEENICDFYMLEPSSSEKYLRAFLIEKGREVE